MGNAEYMGKLLKNLANHLFVSDHMFRHAIKLSLRSNTRSTLKSTFSISKRYSSATAIENTGIYKKLEELIPKEQQRIKDVKGEFGSKVLGECTVDQAYGGMRSVKSMVWETSLLDSEEGIRFRGFTIPELQKSLPTAVEGGEPLPEALLLLLLTGEVPTQEETNELSRELAARGELSDSAMSIIDALPRDMHPMTQLCTGVLALQPDSKFAAAYNAGIHKSKYWEVALDDSLDLIAKLPAVAARIYRNTFKNGEHIDRDTSLDWSANYAKQLGFGDNQQFVELMRLYLTIHADHEGGNVSAHATHLVGSALSDPYLSFTGGMTGLAGPLHGLANQEVLTWLLDVQKEIGDTPTDAEVEAFLWDTLNAGRVVPGYGHAVLRKTDPRYEAQRQYALKHLPDDKLFKLVGQVYEIAPRVLTEHGKTKNPWPNVDAHSGCLLVHYGLKEQSYYTVMFGVSRALGVLAQGVWSRALGYPIERPKSMTTDAIVKFLSK